MQNAANSLGFQALFVELFIWQKGLWCFQRITTGVFKSETMGLSSDKAWKNAAHPYYFTFLV